MRPRCPKCERLTISCICDKIIPLNNPKKIIILRHPTEKSHILGTAKMAELTLNSIECFTGEDFTENKKLLTILENSNCALFKPGLNSSFYEQSNKNFDTLIFIDGTWKKANKIFFLNPVLQKLPTVTFQNSSESIYKLRKEPKSGYLSTFEAILKSCEIDLNTNLKEHLSPLEYIQEFQQNHFD